MSLSAKAVVALMGAIKQTGLVPGIGDLDIELARAKEYNKKHTYIEPGDHKAVYETVQIGRCPVLIIRPHRKATEPEQNKVIMFLHGGGDRDTWKPEVSFARNYGKQTGLDVFYPIYPPFTEVSVTETADMIYQVYRELAGKYSPGNLIVLGESYGGFLTLQLMTWINRNHHEVDMPGLVIMNSPFALPKSKEEWDLACRYEKKDFMVPEGAFDFMLGGILKKDPQTPDYALYPDQMDFHHAPETYVFYAEESCACVADSIQRSYERDGAGERMHMHKEAGMMH